MSPDKRGDLIRNMNRENRDILIQYFGVACANIESVLEKLNTYGQQIVDGDSDTEERKEERDVAVIRVRDNTKRARNYAVGLNLHILDTMERPLSMLRRQIIDMETAFDEANEEIGEDKIRLIEKAIDHATFAKRNCDKIYTLLVNMPVVPNNKGNNKGGSRKRHEKRHAKRTVKRHAKRTEKKRNRK
jgi:hypothetical protein